MAAGVSFLAYSDHYTSSLPPHPDPPQLLHILHLPRVQRDQCNLGYHVHSPPSPRKGLPLICQTIIGDQCCLQQSSARFPLGRYDRCML